jgi:hypothetical protein
MSPFPEETQPNHDSKDDNKRRKFLLASLIGLALLSLLVLLSSPGLLIPPGDATDDGEQEAEATDGGDTGGTDTPVETLPVSNNTSSGLENTDQEEPIMPSNGNSFTGGYVSYPGEVKDSRGGGGHGSDDPVVVPDDDQGTGGGGGGGGGGGDAGSGGQAGGTEGCDPQYWQNHPENWPEPLTPTSSFSSVFGLTIPGMEDLTLMEALGLSEGLSDELIREGAAGMLNAMYEEIDYPKSPPTVIRNVVDGLDPQIVESEQFVDDDDMQTRKDLLQAANDLVCPLLPN